MVVFPVDRSIDSTCDTLMSRGQKMAFVQTVEDHRGSCLLPAWLEPSVVWTGKGIDAVRYCHSYGVFIKGSKLKSVPYSTVVVCANTRHHGGYNTRRTVAETQRTRQFVSVIESSSWRGRTFTAGLGYQTVSDSVWSCFWPECSCCCTRTVQWRRSVIFHWSFFNLIWPVVKTSWIGEGFQ